MRKIHSFIKKKFALVFVVFILLTIGIVLGFIDGWKWNEYVSGTLTEIIGIVITVIFVDVMFNKSQKKNARELERKKIIRICRLIDLYLLRYIVYFDQLTNHPGDIFDCKISTIGNAQGILIHLDSTCAMMMNNNQNMFYKTNEIINYIHFSCLYEDSHIFIAGGFRLKIDCFYYYEKKIIKALKRLLTEVNFEYYKDIERLVLRFLDVSISNDISDFVEYNRKVVYESQTKERTLKIEDDVKTLVSASFNESQDFNSRHRGLKPYQMLKNMLNEERSILHQYLIEINKLRNDHE